MPGRLGDLIKVPLFPLKKVALYLMCTLWLHPAKFTALPLISLLLQSPLMYQASHYLSGITQRSLKDYPFAEQVFPSFLWILFSPTLWVFIILFYCGNVFRNDPENRQIILEDYFVETDQFTDLLLLKLTYSL